MHPVFPQASVFLVKLLREAVFLFWHWRNSAEQLSQVMNLSQVWCWNEAVLFCEELPRWLWRQVRDACGATSCGLLIQFRYVYCGHSHCVSISPMMALQEWGAGVPVNIYGSLLTIHVVSVGLQLGLASCVHSNVHQGWSEFSLHWFKRAFCLITLSNSKYPKYVNCHSLVLLWFDGFKTAHKWHQYLT